MGLGNEASSSSSSLDSAPLLPHHSAQGCHLSSQPKTLANIFIAGVGAGVLGLPYTFSRTGWAAGSILLLSVALLTFLAPVPRQALLLVAAVGAGGHRGAGGHACAQFHGFPRPRGEQRVCATLLGFVLPATFHIKVLGAEMGWPGVLSDVLLVVLGLVLAVLGTYSSLVQIVYSSSA